MQMFMSDFSQFLMLFSKKYEQNKDFCLSSFQQLREPFSIECPQQILQLC